MSESEASALSRLSVGSKGSVRGHLILAEVVNDAISKHKEGKTTDYHAIIEHLSAAQMKTVVMRRWLQGLSLCVSKFTKGHEKLVGATLKFVWYDKDAETVGLYVEYLVTLLSAQAHYLHSILSNLTHHLWVPHDPGGGGGGKGGGGGGGGDEKILENIHMAIQAVLSQAPLAASLLMKIVSKSYPFRGKGIQIQELALRNVLYLASCCPTLRDDILELIVHQMLTIDVELPSLEEEEVEEDEESSQDTQFLVDLEAGDCDDKADETPSGVRDKALPEGGGVGGGGGGFLRLGLHHSLKQVMQNEQAEKLDVMMTISLQHLHSHSHHKGTLNLDEAWPLLHSLLRIFERVVLPTHACSHVQFLLFSLTSLHQEFQEHFLDFLWRKFRDPNEPAILRQTTAAYMASYLARSKFVSLETVKLCISVIMQWIHEYLDDLVPGNLKPDIKQHGPFYSLCQTAFYVFIFRNKPFVEMEKGIEFLRQLNFERVITSRLNPLKVCLSSVVEMFASLASRHEIAFSYTILEQNKRLLLTAESLMGTVQHQHNPLDSFFPFDPYQLKRSRKFITPLYQNWEPSGEEEEEEEEEFADRSSVASSMSCHGQSFTAQSISISPEPCFLN